MNPYSPDARTKANFVRMCGELACLLEVSASPKPGNVHRFSDFADLRYEDFLASSVSLGYWLESLALKGYLLSCDQLSWDKLELGLTIRSAIEQSKFFHTRGNTNLGIILLFSPLAVAAGLSVNENDFISLECLIPNVQKVMARTTVQDSIHVSEGIAFLSPGGLGKVAKYDVTRSSYREELLTDNVNLLQLMSQCSERDNICYELSNGFPIVVRTGFPTFRSVLESSQDVNLATINTYLTILSKYPDSLIKRKFGVDQANAISQRASSIMAIGGATTLEGRREIEAFDIELREEEKLNPGTTADLVAATLFLHFLTGGKL